MVVGGDVLIHTPLAVTEAPFIWLLVSAAAVFAQWLPLLAVFHNHDRRRRWLDAHKGAVPWLASSGTGTGTFIVLSLAYLACSAMAYWTSRGGHEFKHRIAVEVCFYTATGLVGAWPWLAAFANWHVVPALLLALAIGATIAATTFQFVALPLYSGGVGLGACLALIGIFLSWIIMIDGAGRRARAGMPMTKREPTL